MNQSRIVIAGTHSGCGKTTVASGVMAALVKRGLRVQPFKVGPDFIDPMFHTGITGRESRNLDSWLLEEGILRHLFSKQADAADISIVEGVMGLYDGYGVDSIVGSTAHVAKIIRAPVVLVIDGEGMALSLAALVQGFRDFDRTVTLGGIILNNIYNDAHYRFTKEIITNRLGIPVLGYLPKKSEYGLENRHLGLVSSAEVVGLTEKIERLAFQVEMTIELDRLLNLAANAGKLEETPWEKPIPKNKEHRIRLAVARDKAFNFYYADNLDLLNAYGADLVFFSPMEDERLPDGIAGLYLGGGYPEIHAAQLQANRQMRENIRRSIANGLPVYAECGGLMYLGENLRDTNGDLFEMVGIIPGRSRMTDSLQRFGYVQIDVVEDNVISRRGDAIRGHEFHFSEIEMDGEIPTCFNVSKTSRDNLNTAWQCGFKVQNLLAGYPHLHFWSNPAFASRFIRSCKEFQGDGLIS